jgi:hypothetical protein
MIANLYICEKTFAHNGVDDNAMVVKKMLIFVDFFQKVREYPKENVFYLAKERFIDTPVLSDGTTVSGLLDYDTCCRIFRNKDVNTVFLSLFKRCEKTLASIDDMMEYLTLEDAENVHAIVVMNKIPELSETKQVLSSYASWLDFRRYYLAKYPVGVDYFLDESKKYFPRLLIHDSVRSGLKEVILSHPVKIVQALSLLNDELIEEYKANGSDWPQFLQKFGTQPYLDGASMSGIKDEKFRLHFEGDKGPTRYCESHLKMNSNDSGDARQYCRIYFSKPKPEDQCVYVGVICRHL